MIAHPAGPRHAEEVHHGGAPAATAVARPRCSRSPRTYGRATRFATTTAWCRSPEWRSADIAAEFGTPLFVIDEDDFRSRCREIAAAFGGGEHVHYAAKAFLCSEIARWIAEEGLSLDVAHAAASWPSRCMPASRPSGSRCTATTNPSPS